MCNDYCPNLGEVAAVQGTTKCPTPPLEKRSRFRPGAFTDNTLGICRRGSAKFPWKVFSRGTIPAGISINSVFNDKGITRNIVRNVCVSYPKYLTFVLEFGSGFFYWIKYYIIHFFFFFYF